MLPGSLVDTDVQAFSSYIQVNGVTRAHKSWSVNRELVGDLPEQVVASAGVRQATGSIVWAEQPDVTDRAVNPWSTSSGWLPKSGDRVLIWASDGVTSWRQFTGVIDETSASIGGLPESTIIDDYDRLSVRFSHEAMLRIMPPRFRGADALRGIGLSALYYVDAALRKAGFHATPPIEERCSLSVPAQSSMWPEVGVLSEGAINGVETSPAPWANRHNAPFGMSMSNVRATYIPALGVSMDTALQMTFLVAPDHGGNGFLTAYYGGGSVSLAVAGSRTVFARLNGSEVCRLSLGTATVVTLLVKNGVWTLRANNGGTATGAAATPSSGPITSVAIDVDTNARMAGFQVSHPAAVNEFASVSYTPTANYWLDSLALVGYMDAAPAIESSTALDVLQEISKATLTAMWIDEAGVFQWAPSNVLRNRSSMQTITTLDDVRELSWEDSLLGVRSSVDVDYRTPAITRSRWDRVLLYQGGGTNMESGDESEDFIKPGADEDWIQLSSNLLILGDTGSAAPSNNGWGSIAGAVLADKDTDSPASGVLSASLEKISPSTWRLRQVAGTVPAGKKLELRYPSASTTIWPRWLKENLPIIRGFGKVVWANQTLTSSIRGPRWAPVLVHEAGPWSSRRDSVEILTRIADFLAGQVSKPQPTIRDLGVGFDPRRQLGDVITIQSPTLMGAELQALIVGIRNGAGASFTQSLMVRVISAKSTFTTYDQLAAVWAGGNYASLQAAWAALNYNAMASNPLEVSP